MQNHNNTMLNEELRQTIDRHGYLLTLPLRCRAGRFYRTMNSIL